MFRTTKRFLSAMFSVPLGWRMWALLLMVVNLLIPLIFLDRLEGQVTIILFVGCFMLGLILYRSKGFTRILGLRHLPWVLLIYVLIDGVGQTSGRSFFGVWVRTVIILDGTALLLDLIDIFRYMIGERESKIGL